MKKRVFALIIGLIAGLSLAGVLSATPQIWMQHKKLPGGRKRFTSCANCHNNKTGLKKHKGQNIKRLYKTRSCSGRGCH